ncbi:hypothetical protein MW887_004256 [Aspergillus wentii]|nr:hypothetical protein MW887_004256 [Aspergillus wentii]
MATTPFPSINSTYPRPSSETEVLEAFIPGYSFVSRFAASYLHIDISYYVPFLVATGILIASIKFSSGRIWELCRTYFVSTAEIRLDDEIYNYLMFWMAKQPFANRTIHFVAGTKTKSSMRYWEDESDRGSDDEDEEGIEGEVGVGSKNEKGQTSFDDYWARTVSRDKYKKLRFTPSIGTHYFWYRGRLLAFIREQDENTSKLTWLLNNEKLYISCLGRDPTILKELLAEAQQTYVERDGNRTVIYRAQKNGSYFDWVRCMARAPRPLSTVVLDHEQKQAFIEDIKEYLHPRTRRWYFIRGIPYRRGYLLHGPPGTGKTSLCFAASGLLGLKLYLLSLNSKTLDEDGLMSLFQELPRRCIVLLEDVDSAGITNKRSNEEETEPSPEQGAKGAELEKGKPKEEKEEKGGVTLSALLNVIDGVAASEGRILVMTTNHAENLDPALLRPGRVDMSIHFGYADRNAMQELFSSIYATLEGDLQPSYVKRAVEKTNVDEIKRPSRGQIAALAAEFASRVPEGEFTAAEIQGYLLKHKDLPEAAIEGAEEWVETTQKQREEKVSSSARPSAGK